MDKEWLLARTNKNGECLEWALSKNHNGYGLVGVNGKTSIAHRVMYRICHPDVVMVDLEVCHMCDNRACINPEHLFLGTHQDNMDDRERKGRGKVPRLRKERNGRAKLSQADVDRILSGEFKGKSQRAIAQIFGVNQAVISRIINGKSWY